MCRFMAPSIIFTRCSRGIFTSQVKEIPNALCKLWAYERVVRVRRGRAAALIVISTLGVRPVRVMMVIAISVSSVGISPVPLVIATATAGLPLTTAAAATVIRHPFVCPGHVRVREAICFFGAFCLVTRSASLKAVDVGFYVMGM